MQRLDVMDVLLLCLKNTSIGDACGGIAGYSYYPPLRGNPENEGIPHQLSPFVPVTHGSAIIKVLESPISCLMISDRDILSPLG